MSFISNNKSVKIKKTNATPIALVGNKTIRSRLLLI